MTSANTAEPAAVFPEAAALVKQLALREFCERVLRLREMLRIGLAAYGRCEAFTSVELLAKNPL